VNKPRRRPGPRPFNLIGFTNFGCPLKRPRPKGSFKVMSDEVCRSTRSRHHPAKSSIKPEIHRGVVKTLWSILGNRKGDRFVVR